MRAARVLVVALALAVSAAAFAGTKEDIQADMRAGRWTQADARLDEVLAKHPDNALAHYWRAQVKLRLGQLDAARSDLADAKRLDPAHKFSADPSAFARLERELAPPAAATTTPTTTPALSPAIARAPEPLPSPAPVERAQPERAGSHTGTWIVIALIALVVLMVWATRSAKRRGIDAERDRLRALLTEADNDLRDAGKAIDFRAGLTPEQRLALSDRVLRAQGDIASHLSTLTTRTDLAQTHELLRRVRDIAAEVRGEERPSDIEARRELERQQMQGIGMGQGPVIVQQGGSGLGTAGAVLGGVAAGAVLGSILGGSERAHARTMDDGGGRYTPIDDFDGGDASRIDVGGSGGDWSDDGGSSDMGGGGGDFD